MVKRYVKKPIVIEALEWDGLNLIEMKEFCSSCLFHDDILIIPTLEGDHKASVGDFIIRGIKGEFYPCKPDIFEQSYDFHS